MKRRVKILVTAMVFLSAGLINQGLAIGILPVPAVTIYPGEVITGDMLRDGRFVDRYVARTNLMKSAGDIIGKVARRTLVSGRAIPKNALREAFVVRSGQIVTLRYSSGALTILTKAICLQNGQAGQVVRTRNIDSGLQVVGVVKPNGSVEVPKK